jgi:hypothetical protein
VTREVIEKLIDDLDGSAATETVTLGLDGTTYEIDLNKNSAAALRKVRELYVKGGQRGRSAGGRRGVAPASTARKARRDCDIVQLREWACSNGIEVPRSRPHPANGRRPV